MTQVTKMAIEGKNDLMTFLAVLTRFIRRLEAAGIKIDDGKKQRVLLKGLDQVIFQHFINDARRKPYADYDCLYTAVTECAEEPPILEQLRSLRPGNPQSALATRTTQAKSQQHKQQHMTDSQRLDKIEEKIEAIGSSAGCARHCVNLRK